MDKRSLGGTSSTSPVVGPQYEIVYPFVFTATMKAASDTSVQTMSPTDHTTGSKKLRTCADCLQYEPKRQHHRLADFLAKKLSSRHQR